MYEVATRGGHKFPSAIKKYFELYFVVDIVKKGFPGLSRDHVHKSKAFIMFTGSAVDG